MKKIALSSSSLPFTPSDSDGKRLWWKDVCRVGTYHHDATGEDIDITPERLQIWADSFNQRIKAGNPVDVVVDHSKSAKDVYGTTEKVIIEDGVMYAGVDMPTDEGVNLLKCNKGVSIGVDDEVVDHFSISRKPVIPSDSSWMLLSHIEPDNKKQENKTMLDQLKKLFSDDALTEALALEKIGGLLKTETELSNVKKVLEKSKKTIAEKETKITELSAIVKDEKKPEISKDVQEMLSEGFESSLDALVAAGKLSPGCRTELSKVLIGEVGNRNMLLLSATYSGRDTAIAKDIIEALKNNDPREIGEKTRSQSIQLSLLTDDDKKAHEAQKKDISSRAARVSDGRKAS